MATINQHINQLNTPNPNTHNNPIDIDTATDSTTLSSLTTSITKLQQQLHELKKENNNLCKDNNCCPCKCRDNGNYCWTHGYCVGNNHASATCQNKAPGHQDWATHTNTMGGSQANKPEDLRQVGRSVPLVTNKLDTHLANTLIPSPAMAIADTGTTGHFLREATNNAPLIPATPLHVKLPDGHLISSVGTTSINWTGLPCSATQAHVIPKLNPHYLILIGVLCDHDCTATFDKHNVTITCNNYHILHGTHLPNGLWSLPLHSPQPQANALIPANTQEDLVQWLHAAAVSPSISTFLNAVEHNFFTTWLNNRKISMIFPLVSCCSCVNNPSSS